MKNVLKQLEIGKTLVITDISQSVGGKVKTYITEIYKREDCYIVESQTVPSRFGYSTLEEIENYINKTKDNSMDFVIVAK